MTKEQTDALAEAISSIAHGPASGPAGLEGLALALAGGMDGTGGDSVAAGLHDVASGIMEVATAIREFTESVSHKDVTRRW